MMFNPFNMINKNEISNRVRKLREKNPDLSERELCELVIARKSRLCATSGALTALPATVPVIGTAFPLIGGTAVDIAAVSYFMAEMVLEMSAVYGRNLDLPGVSREALWVMGSAVGADMANKAIGKTVMKQMNNQVFVRLIQEVLISLGIRATQRTVLRIIPFFGAVISGTVNYYICRRIGRAAADYYDKNSYAKWAGQTIDVEGEILE